LELQQDFFQKAIDDLQESFKGKHEKEEKCEDWRVKYFTDK